MSAKIDLKFLDESDQGDFLKVEQEDGSIFIEGENQGEFFIIRFDKSTAIRFAKTLRTEINKIQD